MLENQELGPRNESSSETKRSAELTSREQGSTAKLKSQARARLPPSQEVWKRQRQIASCEDELEHAVLGRKDDAPDCRAQPDDCESTKRLKELRVPLNA
ncbi:uncharacterized protein UV8b_00105 [Ustilaginoidea virens]|uniref:Uncharacterized protein n=1 Tax=Ustilaginoidea virens TaxID=1159556 RepID=A0A8E5HI80_USTVR|nr:uncharacterized protein UV8b_00105 [Ustilaginoidea virens]QUC15864.1 hypothetical protein UV8b_00105 [Ustilaginoidea virens]